MAQMTVLVGVETQACHVTRTNSYPIILLAWKPLISVLINKARSSHVLSCGGLIGIAAVGLRLACCCCDGSTACVCICCCCCIVADQKAENKFGSNFGNKETQGDFLKGTRTPFPLPGRASELTFHLRT